MIAAVILAGGEARRLGGGDKPLLEIGGTTLLARILQVLATEIESIAISANGDPQRFVVFDVPVLNDGAFLGFGPLAGILAGLDWAARVGASRMLSVPGDTPFIPPDLARRLAPAPAFAASGGRAHPAVALWPVSCRTVLRERLSGPGSRSVIGFAESIAARRVEFSQQRGDPFMNVNTPADLAAVQQRNDTSRG